MRRVLLALAVLGAGVCGCAVGGAKKMSSSELYLTERMATVLLQEGNAAEAETAFRQALQQDPDNPEMRDGHGLSLLMLGKAKDALGEFNLAVKASPDRGSYLNNRGAARLELGDYAGAEDDFLKAYGSPLPSDKESALVNLGRARFRRGLYQESEDALTRAIALNASSFDAYLARGVTREAMNNPTGAVSDYLAALRIKPENLQAMLRVGLGLIGLKKDKLGQRYLRRICELAPDSPEATRARVVLGEESSVGLPRR
jgi:tetratricopeptide (TPR) repeat protein